MDQPNSATDYDVVIIGAGISGINAAYRLQERNPELSYIILEGRHEMGGTWSLFKYPGLRSDSDLYTFGFQWRNWTETSSIAQGDRIINYVKESAEMYGIDKKIKYNHKVDTAAWSSDKKAWSLNVTANGSEKKTINARWLQLCTGYYDYKEPLKTTIPGIENFKGDVVHTQFWNEDLDYKNKNVVIIGSGATAVTLLRAT
jgi:cation diffusion facilitator CzcD-associated flavoprotein CzcO